MLKPTQVLLFCSGLLALTVPACRSTPETPYSAGEAHMSFSSPATANNVDVQVWYPAPQSVGERQVFYTTAYWGHAAPDAALDANATYPLVILAHGWRGTRFDLSWIAEDLARHGYIVAALDSPGSDAKSYEAAEAPKMWFRAELNQQLIDAVAKDGRFAKNIDTSRVAVMGHSAGGSTALVLAGALPDPANFAKEFPMAAPVVDGPWKDPRIRAVVAMAPGTGPAFSAQSFTNLTVPTLILSGSDDTVSPEAQNAKFYADHVAKSQWHSIPHVSHYTFTPECSPYARLRHFPTCGETPEATDRHTVHVQSLDWIRPFLAQSLGVAQTSFHAAGPSTP